MPTSASTPLTGEIWHLTIDDLLAPLPEAPRLGGPGPFVINLSASTAPISVPMKSITERADVHVYQIQRTEDRRVRYRLRLGPFDREDDAEAVLSAVREIYPGALTATAETDDLKAIESMKVKAETQHSGRSGGKLSSQPPAAAPPAAVAAPTPHLPEEGALPSTPPPAWVALMASTSSMMRASSAAPAPRIVAPSAPSLEEPVAPARPAPMARKAAEIDRVAIPVLSDFVEVPRAAAPPPANARPVPAPRMPPVPALETSQAPAPETRPVQKLAAAAPPVIELELELDPPAPKPAAAPPAPSAPPKQTAPLAAPAPTPAAAVKPAPQPAAPVAAAAPAAASAANKPAYAARPVVPATNFAPPAATLTSAPPSRTVAALATPILNFETTQTLRPLTAIELQDGKALRWFAIQLAQSNESFDPDSLPNLDIFSEYRLYSVAALDEGRVVHALRVGFFAEESAAAAVASYLASFYDKPLVKRISVAERTRFSDQRVEARKDIGATGRHAIIEITDERVVRARRTTAATVTPIARPAPATQAPSHKTK
jgi:hypothetical protein